MIKLTDIIMSGKIMYNKTFKFLSKKMEREEVNFHVLKKWHKNLGRVGTMKQNDRSEVTVGPVDPQHEDLQMCPFYDWSENKIKIVSIFIYKSTSHKSH